MFPVRSFWTTEKAGLPKRPALSVEFPTNWLTEDLDNLLSGLKEGGGVNAGVGDGNVDEGLLISSNVETPESGRNVWRPLPGR